MPEQRIVSIVIVDDDEVFSRNLKRLLEIAQSTFDITVFNDPAALLKGISARNVDVILSDIFMPQMTGLEFIQSLRRVDLDLPVVLLTGTPNDSTTRKAIELGAHAYLVKPPRIEELVKEIERAAFNHKLAKLKRRLAAAEGEVDHRPGDLAGLQDAFLDSLPLIKLAYQPIVSAINGKTMGYEALIRSEHVRLPTAMAVVEAAQSLGWMDRLSDKVFQLAGDASLPKGTRLFLNIVPEDLARLPHYFTQGNLSKLAPYTVLELSERHRLERLVNIDEPLMKLRELGVDFAIDDFGTGLAGIVNFAALRPEFVKVDHSLVSELPTSVNAKRIVQSLLEVCKSQGVATIAEGVENEEALAVCADLGFDYVQGFYIDRPNFGFSSL